MPYPPAVPGSPVAVNAAKVLDAIHADMDTPPPPGGDLKPIPRDVGSWNRLDQYRDANWYLEQAMPYVADDCDCRLRDGGHAGDCASLDQDGSLARWERFTDMVAAEVTRLLAAEAAQLHGAAKGRAFAQAARR